MATPSDWSNVRQELHRRAEVSGQEADTAAFVKDRLEAAGFTIVADDVGGHGVLARVGTGESAVLARAELDALPLVEATGATYAATTAHHACGHDGHMTMLLAALTQLAQHPPCTIWALFQPAEETGEGMANALAHVDFPTSLSAVLSIHNVPGLALGSVAVRPGVAAVASTGLALRFTGATSHAAEPESGRNPIPAVARLVPDLMDAPRHGDALSKAAIVHIGGGAPRFGTSAGDCSISATMRAGTDDALEAMIGHVVRRAEEEAARDNLSLEVERIEPFPATRNDARIVAAVERAAASVGLAVQGVEPFAWSEDFGHATARWPGALIGLGSGTAQPPLHSASYDFPDELLEPGAQLWVALVEALA